MCRSTPADTTSDTEARLGTHCNLLCITVSTLTPDCHCCSSSQKCPYSSTLISSIASKIARVMDPSMGWALGWPN